MDISLFSHLHAHYLFSHTLPSAALAWGPILIFMPVDRFTPVSQTETSVIYLSALFNGALRMRVS